MQALAKLFRARESSCGRSPETAARELPERTARVYMLREVMDMTTEEICQEFGITPTNLWVILHRARLVLRECLEIKWFGAAPR